VRVGLVAAAYFLLAAVSGTVVYALLARGPQGTIELGTPRLVVVEPARPQPQADAGAPSMGPGSKARPRRPARRKRPAPKTAVTPPTRKPAPKPAPTPAPTPAPPPSKPPPPPGAKRPAPKPTSPTPTPAPRKDNKREEAEDAIDRFRAGLNAESVRMVVRHHLPQVRACYDRALKQKPNLAGIVEIRFTISVQGRVTASSVHRNTSGHEGLGKCLAIVIKRWRFPKPVGGAVEFVYPFVFSAAE
jgi:TonB family protein